MFSVCGRHASASGCRQAVDLCGKAFRVTLGRTGRIGASRFLRSQAGLLRTPSGLSQFRLSLFAVATNSARVVCSGLTNDIAVEWSALFSCQSSGIGKTHLVCLIGKFRSNKLFGRIGIIVTFVETGVKSTSCGMSWMQRLHGSGCLF